MTQDVEVLCQCERTAARHIEHCVDEDEGLKGVYDITEVKNVATALKKRGYSDEDIEKVSYRNFIAFFERIRNGIK